MTLHSRTRQLLARAAEGDVNSFGEFYDLHLPEIYRYIFLRIRDPDEAEDLTARVFLDAWEGLTGGRRQQEIRNIRAWLFRIARNKVIDYLRTRRPQARLKDDSDAGAPGLPMEEQLQASFVSRTLAEGIRKLPPSSQEVIILRFVAQMSAAEVAEIMDISESYVRVLQYRALRQIRNLVSEVNDG
jgi:RNA polymerase sigma-70 factor (ECF subfamily)